ncbi:hypothetical protein WJX72_006664 [[Myrmecia] bisecta]|uniref:PMS1 n=1 Tax=[Myrmecia] bisecta TaxID=41462 RepID=A0AAW1PGC8_9CHLO
MQHSGKAIRAIDQATVHRIASGQVILDLATAVKELVENALDAGASVIEVRLKEYGSELVEVADNGAGISPDNHASLALKHHTSKLEAFGDLQALSTFGFRGEALSSLCALTDLSVTTRTPSQPAGVRLTYDRRGRLIGQAAAARAAGTTVSLKDLFKPLPVRHKEFLRHLKREYAKLLTLLQAYAIISTGVRLLCTNQVGAGARSTVISTQEGSTMRDNLITVFGTRTVGAMEALPSTAQGSRLIEGFVSRASVGCARSASDRQFFFVNGRPVDLPKVGKLLNELYRSLSTSAASASKPIAILNFVMPPDSFDVNVTPDKRKVFLHEEAGLLDSLQMVLQQAWGAAQSTFATQDTLGVTQQGRSAERQGLPQTKRRKLGAPQPDSPQSSPLSEPAVGCPRPESCEEQGEPALPGTCGLGCQGMQGRTSHQSTESAPQELSQLQWGMRDAAPAIEDAVEVHHTSLRQVLAEQPSLAAQSCSQVQEPRQPAASEPPLGNEMMVTLNLLAMRRRLKATRQLAPARASEANTGLQKQDALMMPGTGSRVFDKRDFRNMQVLGQFNMGFILARLGQDLFIVDQHASDEKYNFERLQQSLVLKRQPLVCPLPLDLAPADAVTLRDNMETVRRNGFDVRDSAGGLELLAVPFSKNVTFGPEDLEELVTLLRVGSATASTARPSRVRAMLAVRACRSSIMIGRALNRAIMQTILVHLAALDSPWTCPHGRPTMRHLAVLPKATT